MDDMTRRRMLKVAGATGVVATGLVALGGERAEAQAQQKGVPIPPELRKEFADIDAVMPKDEVWYTEVRPLFTIHGVLFCQGDDKSTTRGYVIGTFVGHYKLDKNNSFKWFLGVLGRRALRIELDVAKREARWYLYRRQGDLLFPVDDGELAHCS